MSEDTIPKTEVTVGMPAGNVGHAAVSSSMRDITSVRVSHTPLRAIADAGITVPEYVSLHIGDASVSLAPAVWLRIIDALAEVLDQVPSLTAASNA